MEWETYLQAKKIHSEAFLAKEPTLFREFERVFLQMHPDSFTGQKLFLINQLRRKYPLQASAEQEKAVAKPAAIRPKLKPKT